MIPSEREAEIYSQKPYRILGYMEGNSKTLFFSVNKR